LQKKRTLRMIEFFPNKKKIVFPHKIRIVALCHETPLRALQERAIYSQNTHYRLLLCCDTPLRALQQRSVCATNSKTLELYATAL